MSVGATTAQLTLPTPLAEAHSDWPFITALSVNGISHRTEAVNVVDSRDRVSFRWYTSWGYSELLMFADEGLCWCRGWHESDSPEVKAMKAARALT